ncbi:hypothetical protein ACLEX4_19210 [Pseudescherichia vulneris]
MKRVSIEFLFMKQDVTISEADDIDAITDAVTGPDFKVSLPSLLGMTVGVENNIHSSAA